MAVEFLIRNGWQVAGIASPSKFFVALPVLLPLPVTLCFEGTRIAPQIQALFLANAVTPGLEIPTGTIWPKPSAFHVLGTEEFLRRLAALGGRNGRACDHFHAYKDGRGLLQWYDAFSSLPLLVDESISEEALQNFCDKLGARYISRARK